MVVVLSEKWRSEVVECWARPLPHDISGVVRWTFFLNLLLLFPLLFHSSNVFLLLKFSILFGLTPCCPI